MLVDLADDGGEVDAVGGRLPGLLQQRQMDLVQPVDPAAALRGIGRRLQCQQAFDHLIRIAGHAQIGAPDAADLVRIGPDMDQRQLRLRRGGKRVGLADGVGQPLTQRDDQVGLLHLADQRRRDADAHVAAVIGMAGIEQLRPAMGGIDRQHPFLRQAAAGRRRPLARAGCRPAARRPPGSAAAPPWPAYRASRSRSCVRGPATTRGLRQVQFGVGGFVEDILRQDHRDRAGRAAFGDVEGARDGLRGLLRLVHLDDAFGDVGQQSWSNSAPAAPAGRNPCAPPGRPA